MSSDKLDDMFERQKVFMDELVDFDKLPEYPVDLSTKNAQRIIKEYVYNCVEELCEATYTLKNKVHRVSDDRAIDFEHYREELGDALAYFIEVCHLSGINADEIYTEYCRKNAIVREKLKNGY